MASAAILKFTLTATTRSLLHIFAQNLAQRLKRRPGNRFIFRFHFWENPRWRRPTFWKWIQWQYLGHYSGLWIPIQYGGRGKGVESASWLKGGTAFLNSNQYDQLDNTLISSSCSWNIQHKINISTQTIEEQTHSDGDAVIPNIDVRMFTWQVIINVITYVTTTSSSRGHVIDAIVYLLSRVTVTKTPNCTQPAKPDFSLRLYA